MAGADLRQIQHSQSRAPQPSFSTKKSGWMAEHEHWLPRGIAVAKKFNHALRHLLQRRMCIAEAE